jgi:putative pyruvate formate lyase activating enzyme
MNSLRMKNESDRIETAGYSPAYLELFSSGELKRRAEAALKLLSPCRVCPRRCGVDRLAKKVSEDHLAGVGTCRSGRMAKVSSFGPHYGEERPLVGSFGSGTIFFTNCNLRCLFCQNYDISHLGQGEDVSAEQLADIMLNLQRMGCHNINLVSPTHFAPQILEALCIAAGEGLRLPLVYNTGGYDSFAVLALLEGIVDIYMPDAKYWDPEVAGRLSEAADYPEVMRQALKEMHRQVGDLAVDESGVARRGLLVRHLVLPEGLAGTQEVMEFIAKEVSTNTYVNVMAQFRPCYRAHEIAQLRQPISNQEHQWAIQAALRADLQRLDGI